MVAVDRLQCVTQRVDAARDRLIAEVGCHGGLIWRRRSMSRLKRIKPYRGGFKSRFDAPLLRRPNFPDRAASHPARRDIRLWPVARPRRRTRSSAEIGSSITSTEYSSAHAAVPAQCDQHQRRRNHRPHQMYLVSTSPQATSCSTKGATRPASCRCECLLACVTSRRPTLSRLV